MKVCHACQATISPGDHATICEVRSGTPVYSCEHCWRSLNNPARQRRLAQVRQRRIELLLTA